ncbi:MAG: NfeD family protein [Acidobacteria bacterium]|nr:NfeD family protein [Acidobacteriota bacterium]
MSELFSSVTPLAVFLGIAAVGLLFLAITLILGDLFEHDVGFDHGVEVGHDLGGHDHAGPSYLNTRVISVFVTAFGGFGAIGAYLGFGVLPSSLFGLVGGFALGWVVYVFARFLYSQQASSDLTLSDLLGQTAKVTVTIPRGGLGQVRCVIGESQIEKIACSSDGSEIPFNTMVRIEDIQADAVIVRKVESMEGGSAVDRLLNQ